MTVDATVVLLFDCDISVSVGNSLNGGDIHLRLLGLWKRVLSLLASIYGIDQLGRAVNILILSEGNCLTRWLLVYMFNLRSLVEELH